MSHLLTLSEVIASHARLQPGKIGARDSQRALTFNDWNDRASRLANGLLALGLSMGQWLSLPMIIAGGAMLAWPSRRPGS